VKIKGTKQKHNKGTKGPFHMKGQMWPIALQDFWENKAYAKVRRVRLRRSEMTHLLIRAKLEWRLNQRQPEPPPLTGGGEKKFGNKERTQKTGIVVQS